MRIFTSLAPYAFEKQSRAIRSWCQHGFKPCSLNRQFEIEALQADYPEVTFIKVERDAHDIVGKPLVYFDDFLGAINAGSDSVAGIVNSDIIFGSESNLPELFGKHAENGLVYGSRIDINNPTDTEGQVYFQGFDFFFMDRSITGIYPPTQLCMGAPMWDYWVPIMVIIKRLGCKKLKTPFAYHVKHPQQWDDALNIRMMREIVEHSGLNFADAGQVDFSSMNENSMRLLIRFGHSIIPYLKANSADVY